jgi:xanthine/uracil permease
MGKTLDALFPPFKDSPRVKPDTMLWVAHESPDRGTVFLAAGQHAIVVLMLVVFTALSGREAGLTGDALRGFVALEIVVIGLATFTQSRPWRLGSGHLIVHNPSVISLASYSTAAAAFGIAAASGGLILSAIVVISLSRLLPKMRQYFPPEVAGVLLVLLGLSMVESGLRRFTGYTDGHVDGAAVAIGAITLVTVIALSVWATGRVKLFAMLAGTLLGLGVSLMLGQFGTAQFETIHAQPLFAFPWTGYSIPFPKLVLAAALPILMIELVSAIDSIGSGVAIDKMNNARWLRADLPMIGRVLTSHGLGVLFAGLLGTHPVGTSSANLGLAYASGVSARKVGTYAGLLVLVIAFLPKISALIIAIPQPVVGAIIVYTAAYMLVSGMELILSRMMNARRMFVVGISLVGGAMVIVMPELTENAPKNMAPVLGSALTVGGALAIVLNAVFRIGIARKATLRLTGVADLPKLTTFLEDNGKAWGARQEVIAKAGLSVGETLEKLGRTQQDVWPVELTTTFDEYTLVLTLHYRGEALALGEGRKIDGAALLEDDAALDRAVQNVSGVLMHQLADGIVSEKSRDGALVQLQFEH